MDVILRLLQGGCHAIGAEGGPLVPAFCAFLLFMFLLAYRRQGLQMTVNQQSHDGPGRWQELNLAGTWTWGTTQLGPDSA